MDLHLKDKIVLVTGGSRGLGRAVCLTMAAEGARVAVNYRSRESDAMDVVRVIEAEHSGQGDVAKAVAVQANVTDELCVRDMFDRVESELGPVDVLVNNAGTWPTGLVRDMPLDAWNDAVGVNLTGPFLTCREMVQRRIASERPGRIVNVTSQAAHHGATSGHSHYAAAKAGLTNFTYSLAREVAQHGITVNAVAPGVMPTEMIGAALEANAERYLARIPLGRWGDPSEIAAAVAFLASDQASYITGTTLDVNGGMVMR